MCGICADNSKLAKCNSKFTVHCTGQFSLHEEAVPVSSVSAKSVPKVHSATLRDHESILTYIIIVLLVHVWIIRMSG